MKKISLALIIFLIIGLSWSGYNLYLTNRLHDQLTEQTKVVMVTGMIDTQDHLESLYTFITDPNNLDEYYWSDINTSIANVLTSTIKPISNTMWSIQFGGHLIAFII